jgi:hypothetical protein
MYLVVYHKGTKSRIYSGIFRAIMFTLMSFLSTPNFEFFLTYSDVEFCFLFVADAIDNIDNKNNHH